MQLDCPDLALARHMTFKYLSEDEFLNREEKQIEFLNQSLENIPQSKIRYATYVKDRIDGFSGESERKAPKDRDDFPTFKERIA